ncbi:MAG: NADH dehydrogenase [ubiquinone] 1 alpha subcomplex assembly factor 1 [Paraglaciecola sp.]|jgi:NADH dehydrogenase [ubiquinone] 1 alpha subcomplex assembly factor 1
MSIRMISWAVAMMLTTTVLGAQSVKASVNTQGDRLVLSFDQPGQRDDWQVINDGVMGGLSVGKTQLKNQTFIFYGSISTKNNGGFTSVYRPIVAMPQEFKSVEISVKGDGKLYQLRMRSQVMGYDLAYKINFTTKEDTMQTLTFNLADFQASFRGTILSGAPILKAETISHVGFLMSSKQATDFSLSTYGIAFY